jgi:ATP-dependent DNA helicase RecG
LISAISNAARLSGEICGYVVWGIDDDNHKVVGTQFRPSAEKARGQPLEFWLASCISPDLNFSFKDVPHPGGKVVILEIPAAATVPTKFRNISYIRIGPATPKLSDYPGHEAGLIAKLQPFVWEQGVAESFVSTATFCEHWT